MLLSVVVFHIRMHLLSQMLCIQRFVWLYPNKWVSYVYRCNLNDEKKKTKKTQQTQHQHEPTQKKTARYNKQLQTKT